MTTLRIALRRDDRLLLRLALVGALAASGTSYVLHHTPPLEGHGLAVAAVVIAAAALCSLPIALAPSTRERLPMFVTLTPGNGAIRPMSDEDLDLCAALQAATLAHGFYAALGQRFLRAYLATFASSPHAIALVVATSEVPAGMVVGTVRPAQHTRWLLRHHGVRLATLGAAALAVRPRLAARFVRTRVGRYRRAWHNAKMPARPQPRQVAVLSHVAVAPGAQRAGLGSRLVGAFLDAATAAGSEQVILSTLTGTAGAADFYRRSNWREQTTTTSFDGTPMAVFSIDLPPQSK